jgi:Cu/Ag efflux protein CusF
MSATSAEGKWWKLDAKTGNRHAEPRAVASLKWPAMTMEFKVANGELLKGP